MFGPTVGEGTEVWDDDYLWFVYVWMKVAPQRLIYHFYSGERNLIWDAIEAGVAPSKLAKRGYTDAAGRVCSDVSWWWSLVRAERRWREKRIGRGLEWRCAGDETRLRRRR